MRTGKGASTGLPGHRPSRTCSHRDPGEEQRGPVPVAALRKGPVGGIRGAGSPEARRRSRASGLPVSIPWLHSRQVQGGLLCFCLYLV